MRNDKNQRTIRNVPRPRLLSWVFLGLSMAFLAASLVMQIYNLPSPVKTYQLNYSDVVLGFLYPLTGFFILAHQSRNRIGWLFLVIAASHTLWLLLSQYRVYGLYTHPDSLPYIRQVVWLLGFLWMPVASLYTFLIMLFPDGQLPFRGRRWLSGFAYAPAVLALLLAIFSWNPARLPPKLPANLIDNLANLVILLIFMSWGMAVLVLILRFRSASGVARQQLKWFTFGGALFLAGVLGLDSLQPLLTRNAAGTVLFSLLQPVPIACLPLAIGIAILRYRLFDIDLIIRRTLSYALLTVSLAGLYFGSVIMLQQFIRALTGAAGRSPVAVVISTLTIAALFSPLRRRIQLGIDRRFYRQKYDTEQVLAKFGFTLREEVDLDHLSNSILAVVKETIQPAQVSIWLRKNPPAKANPYGSGGTRFQKT